MNMHFFLEYFFLFSGHLEHHFGISEYLHDKETWEIDVEMMDPIRRILTFSHRSSTWSQQDRNCNGIIAADN